MVDNFSKEICEELKYYVYRLIDPRNGETFYVGKGKGNRVFQHAKGKFDENKAGSSQKLTKVRDIQNSSLDVQHVIHRHGMDEKTAYEVEAALIEAYPSVSNDAGGHGSADRGVAHAVEIVEKYSAEAVEIEHKVVEILINKSASERGIYDATRFAWKISPGNARKADYVFAVLNGIVLEVFEDANWMPATKENFPGFPVDDETSKRFGFTGKLAGDGIRNRYLRKRMPPRPRGAANPIRYFGI